MISNWLNSLLGTKPWRKEWRDELSQSLGEAQKSVRASMVVIIARESDIYSELLFVFSFLGLSLGALLGWVFKSYFARPEDLLIIPLALYSLGTSIYALRRFYVGKIIPGSVKHRVFEKAKSHFFDSHVVLKERLALIYISEIEKEALLLCSPDIQDLVPKEKIHLALMKLTKSYSLKAPMVSLRPCLFEIAEILKQALNARDGENTGFVPNPKGVDGKGSAVKFVSASDRPPKPLAIPILKGPKDIN